LTTILWHVVTFLWHHHRQTLFIITISPHADICNCIIVSPRIHIEIFHQYLWLITGFVTRLTRRVPLVEQELYTLPEYLSSPPDFSRVRVTRSLVLCVCFVDRCLSLWTLSFGHYVVCSSSIYGFWLPLWYLQTLLITILRFVLL